MFKDLDDLKAKVENLNKLSVKGVETSDKIDLLLKSATEKRNEINKIHLEIDGFSEVDEDGEAVGYVPGLKDKLKNSYDEIEKKVISLQKQLDGIINDSKKNLESKIVEFEATYQEVNNKIKSLLPQALTAGLSSAYFEKRKDEEKEEKKQTTYFTIAIVGMILVSFIPFAVSTNQLLNNVALPEVLMQLPRMVLAILPLYVPVLWFAYSSNRKRNLSKRLIEEYTHKEVLSKTFEGLSTQIANIEDSSISSDLRNKLLYNVLAVTSENPGKLISDYNKSDHPFMEALDKSIQLSNSVEKLSKIPGMNKLMALVEKKSKKIMGDKTIEAEKGIDIVSADDDNE